MVGIAEHRVQTGGFRIGRGLGRRTLAAVGLAVALLLAPDMSRADMPPQPAPLTASDQADLQRIAAYLNSIGTMTARFHQ